jgi:hypothetical protein
LVIRDGQVRSANGCAPAVCETLVAPNEHLEWTQSSPIYIRISLIQLWGHFAAVSGGEKEPSGACRESIQKGLSRIYLTPARKGGIVKINAHSCKPNREEKGYVIPKNLGGKVISIHPSDRNSTGLGARGQSMLSVFRSCPFIHLDIIQVFGHP